MGTNQRFEFALNLRLEHYPFWSKDRLRSVKQIDIFAQSSEAELNIFDKDNKSGSLTEDSTFGNLLYGKFANQDEIVLLDKPVAEFSISFEKLENRSIKDLVKDLLIAATWSSQ